MKVASIATTPPPQLHPSLPNLPQITHHNPSTPLGAYPTARQITRTAKIPSSISLRSVASSTTQAPSHRASTKSKSLADMRPTHKLHALHRLALSPTASSVSCIQRMTSPSHQSNPLPCHGPAKPKPSSHCDPPLCPAIRPAAARSNNSQKPIYQNTAGGPAKPDTGRFAVPLSIVLPGLFFPAKASCAAGASVGPDCVSAALA